MEKGTSKIELSIMSEDGSFAKALFRVRMERDYGNLSMEKLADRLVMLLVDTLSKTSICMRLKAGLPTTRNSVLMQLL